MAEATLDFPEIDESLISGKPATTPDDPRMAGVIKPYTQARPVAEKAAPASIKELVVAQFDAMKPKLQALVARFSGAAFDLKTTKGLEAAKAARHALREEGRFLVQRAVDGTKKEARELNKLLDTEGEKLIAIVRPREDEFDALIKKREDEIEAEKVRERAEQQARLDKLSAAVAIASEKAPEQITNAITHLQCLVVGVEKWGTAANVAEGERERLRVIAELTRIRDDKVRAADLAKREAEVAIRERELAAVAPAGWRPTFRPPVEIPADEPAPPPVVTTTMATEPSAEVDVAEREQAMSTITVGEIARRLGFALPAAFIEESLHVLRMGTKGPSVLFAENAWPSIKAALIGHIGGLQ